jgi:hypothetical protein
MSLQSRSVVEELPAGGAARSLISLGPTAWHRLDASITVSVVPGSLSLIGMLQGDTDLVIMGIALVPFAALLYWRATRICLNADREGIRVRNTLRDLRYSWRDVEQIWSGGKSWVAYVAFYRTPGDEVMIRVAGRRRPVEVQVTLFRSAESNQRLAEELEALRQSASVGS